MSDDESWEPLQLGKRTVDAIIEGLRPRSGRARPKSGLILSPSKKKKIDRFFPNSTRSGVKLHMGECTASRQLLMALPREGRGAEAPPADKAASGCSGPVKLTKRPGGAVAPECAWCLQKGVQWPL